MNKQDRRLTKRITAGILAMLISCPAPVVFADPDEIITGNVDTYNFDNTKKNVQFGDGTTATNINSLANGGAAGQGQDATGWTITFNNATFTGGYALYEQMNGTRNIANNTISFLGNVNHNLAGGAIASQYDYAPNKVNLQNNALNINGGAITDNQIYIYSSGDVETQESNTLTIDNGNISSSWIGISTSNVDTATGNSVVINGGNYEGDGGFPQHNFSAVGSYVNTANNNTITVNGGIYKDATNFETVRADTFEGEGNNITVNGGTFEKAGWLKAKKGNVVINDVNFSTEEAYLGIQAFEGTATINGGTFTDGGEITALSTTITDGTFKNTVSLYAVDDDTANNVVISGGDFSETTDLRICGGIDSTDAGTLSISNITAPIFSMTGIFDATFEGATLENMSFVNTTSKFTSFSAKDSTLALAELVVDAPTFENTTFTGDVSSTSTVEITSGSTINGNVEAGTALTLTDSAINTTLGTVSAGTTADISNSSIVGDLQATGNATLNKGTVEGNLTTGAIADISNQSSITGDLQAVGNITLANSSVGGDLTSTTGSATLSNGASVGGDLTVKTMATATSSEITGNINAESTISLTGTNVGGDISTDADISVLGNSDITGSAAGANAVITSSAIGTTLTATGSATLSGATIGGKLTAGTIADISNNSLLKDDIEAVGDISLSATEAQKNITSTTGKVEIVGNSTVLGDVNSATTATVNGSTVSGDLTATTATLSNGASVGGTITAQNIALSGATAGGLTATQGLTIEGNSTVYGDATATTTTAKNSTIYGNITGTDALTLESATISGNAVGYNNAMAVNGKTITWSNSNITGAVDAVKGAGNASATSNQIALNGVIVASDFRGISAGTVENNEITLTGGQFKGITGFIDDEYATGNVLNINAGTTTTGNIYLTDAVISSNNTLNLSSMLGLNNTTIISSNKNATGMNTNNTLNIRNVNGATVGQLEKWQNINIYVPGTAHKNDVILTIAGGNATDLRGTAIKAGIAGDIDFGAGDKISLLKNASGLTTDGTTTYGTLTAGVSTIYEGLTVKKQDDNTVILTIPGNPQPDPPAPGPQPPQPQPPQPQPPAPQPPAPQPRINPETKSLLSAQIASAEMVQEAFGLGDEIQGAEIFGNGLFAVVGGGQIDREDVKSKNAHFILGWKRQDEEQTAAAYVHYGRGNYDSDIMGINASGNTSLFGVGGYARQALPDDLFVDGGLSVGQVQREYSGSGFSTVETSTSHGTEKIPYFGIF